MFGESTVGVPVIAQFVGFNTSPAGKEGFTLQEVTPPTTDGVMFTVWFVLIEVEVPNGKDKFCGAKVFIPKFRTIEVLPN